MNLFCLFSLAFLCCSTAIAQTANLILDDLQSPQDVRCGAEHIGEVQSNQYAGSIGSVYGGERSIHCALVNSPMPVAEVSVAAGLLSADFRSSSGAVGVGSIILDGAGIGAVPNGEYIPAISEGFKQPLNLSGYKGLVFQFFFDFASQEASDLTFVLHSSVEHYSKYIVHLSRAMRYENVFLPLSFNGTSQAITLRGTTITSPLIIHKQDSPVGAADLTKIRAIKIIFNGDKTLGLKPSVDMQFSGELGGICAWAGCSDPECLTRSSNGLQNGCYNQKTSGTVSAR